MERLERLFLQTTGKRAESIIPLTTSGSNRQYFRLRTGRVSQVGVLGTSLDENKAFISIDRHMRAKGLAVPEVYAVSDDNSCYLQEDLGDTLLYDMLKGRVPSYMDVAAMALRQLPRLQFLSAEGLDFNKCYPVPSLDIRSVMWDLNYFKYCFVKGTGIDFSEPQLEDDFEYLAGILLSEQADTFLYRDFQSRNVMVKDGIPYFIDFQGGRRGPIFYDVVSFLWQASAGFTDKQRDTLIDAYLEALQPFRSMDKTTFMAHLRYFVLFRLLQVLGAYGFRGLFERKAYFLQGIPLIMDSLRHELEIGFDGLPYLMSLLERIVSLPRFKRVMKPEGLTVDVCSFSYRRGIPEDTSGNGGGFVFDCRAIHNPGRYDQYKSFTGHDAPVVTFLDATEGMTYFLQQVYNLVDQSVDRYLDRGFDHLSVSFGCTGGQHRSVYAADHLAAHLMEKYPQVTTRLTHREQPHLSAEQGKDVAS